MKRYLFIISRSPSGSSHALEQLEAAMVAAVFDAKVAVLFRDEGAWCIQQHQAGAAIGQKTMTNVLAALPAYDVEELYVCADFLNTYQIQTEPTLSVMPIRLPEQQALISACDVVITAQP
jgi:tRNA 2-thiouridine synthesizing protein C